MKNEHMTNSQGMRIRVYEKPWNGKSERRQVIKQRRQKCQGLEFPLTQSQQSEMKNTVIEGL